MKRIFESDEERDAFLDERFDALLALFERGERACFDQNDKGTPLGLLLDATMDAAQQELPLLHKNARDHVVPASVGCLLFGHKFLPNPKSVDYHTPAPAADLAFRIARVYIEAATDESAASYFLLAAAVAVQRHLEKEARDTPAT